MRRASRLRATSPRVSAATAGPNTSPITARMVLAISTGQKLGRAKITVVPTARTRSATTLLPLVGQKLAAANKEFATAMMSACIVAAQLVMLPIAVFCGRTADRLGRKPILLVGFAILPIRAVLYTLSDNSAGLSACSSSMASAPAYSAR
jgi:MFS family permease